MMPGIYLKVAKIAIPALIGALAAGFAVYKVQQVRIDGVRAELKQARIDLSACNDANTANQLTISALKKDLDAAHKLCSERVRAKNRLISRLRRIDALRTLRTGGDDAQGDNSDALLGELNRMFSAAADSKD